MAASERSLELELLWTLFGDSDDELLASPPEVAAGAAVFVSIVVVAAVAEESLPLLVGDTASVTAETLFVAEVEILPDSAALPFPSPPEGGPGLGAATSPRASSDA